MEYFEEAAIYFLGTAAHNFAIPKGGIREGAVKRNAVSIVLSSAMVILPMTLFATGASAATYKVLYSFGASQGDGSSPCSSLVVDRAGNLYGTTETGGADGGGGTVFELTPAGDGSWAEKLLHSFGHQGVNGANPIAGPIMDSFGNLYGTTNSGGSDKGVVFKLAPGPAGSWMETVLHTFAGGNDGDGPNSSLILDGAGNLYGTTYQGGSDGQIGGTVFEVNASTGQETVLEDFKRDDGGSHPVSLVFDAAGNLYGATSGADDGGTVYQLAPAGGEIWNKTALHHFKGNGDGFQPEAGVIFDAAGNLYGTTFWGGANVQGNSSGWGTVFELMPQEGGEWKEKILHSFHSEARGGEDPVAGLVFDAEGDLYGTTYGGGDFGEGEVFKLSPVGDGGWSHTVLHAFGHGTDGAYPNGSLVVDAAGNLYGTTVSGGSYGVGTVFETTP